MFFIVQANGEALFLSETTFSILMYILGVKSFWRLNITFWSEKKQ